jgi:peptide chain release factor 2
LYQTQASSQDLWTDPQKTGDLLKKISRLQYDVTTISEHCKKFADLHALLDLAKEEDDEGVFASCCKDLEALSAALGKLYVESLLSGEADHCNCFLEIHAGAGGTESQDWVAMLSRMYSRWAQARGFTTDIVDETVGEGAGFKSVQLKISGLRAYGWLKTENGVHRLVRISPFDANARRHTSFASVWTYPETDDEIEIKIEEKDLQVDTFRSSGAGGQHVNKTDSAVRITHLPTGIVVSCQVDRSQHRNRALALSMLKSRLYEAELRKKQDELDEQNKQKTDIAWGNQIRSYVLQPYQLVKDMRTGVEIGNAAGVLDGNIEPFLEQALVHQLMNVSN